MAEMALNTVAYIILALVSIGLILSLVPKLSESASKQYCSAYTKSTLSGNEQIPEECLAYVAKGVDKTIILSGNATDISSSLAAYLVSCYRLKAPMCYTVQLSATDRQITNSDVNEVLLARGVNVSTRVPDLFPNNSLIVIGYDSSSDSVVVK